MRNLTMTDPRVEFAGQIGGVFAGVIALLVAIGHGVRWLLNWNDARAQTRSAKLDAWHAELKAREARLDAEQAAYQARIEARLKDIEAESLVIKNENHALRYAFELVAAPLRALDPNNKELARPEEIIAAAFPLLPVIPPDMADKLSKLD